MNTPRFAIAMPVCDQAEFIRTALRSLQAQRVPFDLAVLDATRDDSVQRVVREFGGIVHWGYHHPDDGQAAAIATGWANTRGDILGWLNADDYYYPDTLASVQAVFDSNPDVDVVYGHAAHVDLNGHFENYYNGISDDAADVLHNCPIAQPACFVRRRAIDRIGGIDTSLHYTMDWDLWVRLQESGAKFRFLDRPLAVVTIHPATKTMSGITARYAEMDRILARHNGWASRRWVLFQHRLHDTLYRMMSATGLMRPMANRAMTLIKYLRFGLGKQQPPILGLRPWSNRIVGTGQIRLPIYATGEEVRVTVFGRFAQDVDVVIDGVRAVPIATAARGTRQCLIKSPAQAQCLDVRIHAPQGYARLDKVCIEPVVIAEAGC